MNGLKKGVPSKICKPDMTFEECELALLRQAIDEGEKQEGKKLVNNPNIRKMLVILENFLRRGKNMCYGGIALNAVLPKKSQFYDTSVELPDYDFFSTNALEDAIELCQIYYKAGFEVVEAKSGVHHGTYKVYVNYLPMADITQMEPVIFQHMMQESVVIDGIHYSPILFLRMALFIELSRPQGDISRWEKVFKRMQLFNRYYPLKSLLPCELIKIQRGMTRIDTIEKTLQSLSKRSAKTKQDVVFVQKKEEEMKQELEKRKKQEADLYETVRAAVIEEGGVFFGGYAASLYADKMPAEERKWVAQIPDFDVLAEQPEKCVEKIVSELKKGGYEDVMVKVNDAVGEYIPKHWQVIVFGNETICFVYEPIACHSYNEIVKGGKKIKVATIDTILSLYLVFIYSGKPYFNRERILCISQYLFEVEERNRLEQKGVLKRFTMTCVGKQLSMSDLREEKAAKFNELKNRKKSEEYQSWFLKYNPATDPLPIQMSHSLQSKTPPSPKRVRTQKKGKRVRRDTRYRKRKVHLKRANSYL